MLEPRIKTLFTLGKLAGVGSGTLWKISAADEELSATPGELAQSNPRVRKALEVGGAWERACMDAEIDLDQARDHQAKILHGESPLFPPLLRAASSPPFFLYVRGRIENLLDPSVAVIGTRQPTAHGQEITKRLTGMLIEEGWVVVSGLAIGCDSIAHQTCVQRQGRTVAVLAHGLHTIAPRANAALAEDILANDGTLVSEYAFGVEPLPNQFVQRDYIQAGISSGVVMIQSGITGGSLHAAGRALKLGRLLVVPAPTDQDRSNNDPKIQANLAIESMDETRMGTLFGIGPIDPGRIMILRGRGDYKEMLARMGPHSS